MKQLVIMPGGFHPFHAGHAALYQSAVEAFPGADVYVAATNDTSTRPFPFQVKEKLAQLAGVPKGRFTQVKSPFRAEEITAPYDPNNTQLIFVRSDKDTGSQPRPGGVKKDGTPGYLQPYDDASDLPMSQQAYMAYLPTVEFGPGMTSATEIRSAWPKLNEKRKTALVMSLYPKTQTNPRLAATVVKLLDTAIGTVDESALDNLPRPNKRNQFKSLHRLRKQRGLDEQGVEEALKPDAFKTLQQAKQRIEQNRQQEVDQWAQDFRANSSKLAGQQLRQRVSPPPVPVAQPGEKHAVLKNRISQLDQAINKQQQLDALTQKLEHKGLLTPAMQMDFDTRMYVRDAAADDYQALNQKLDRAIALATNRLRTNKLAFKEDPDYIEEGRKI